MQVRCWSDLPVLTGTHDSEITCAKQASMMKLSQLVCIQNALYMRCVQENLTLTSPLQIGMDPPGRVISVRVFMDFQPKGTSLFLKLSVIPLSNHII